MDYYEKFEPFTLSYTCPHTGIRFEIWCGNSDKADQEFERMFDRCGRNVKYSID